MTAPRLRLAVVAAALGGLVGSLLRYLVTEPFTIDLGFPWPVFAINVLGAALLAGLPLLGTVRRSPLLAVFLGTGVLGGFTTMSTASEQTVVLLDHGRTATALCYAGGTLLAALAAAHTVSRFVPRPARIAAERDEVDE